jgi:hypothetical protein
MVTTTVDSVPGSLRAAIMSANSQSGASTIDFSISSGAQTIELASPLPTIAQPVLLDGSTQPGFMGTPLIQLDGKNAQPSSDGLVITAGSSTVRDLAVTDFGGSGIVLSGSGGNMISGSFIGVAPGTGAAAGNGQRGIFIHGSSNNTIGGTSAGAGNCISANSWSGIRIDDGGSGNVIEGNLIGTSVSGSKALGNAAYGIRIAAGTNNQIGGSADSARNVVSANAWSGVCLDDGSQGNMLEGNYIGTDDTGMIPLGNHQRGVFVSEAAGNSIGGTVAGSGNVISANLWSGVLLYEGASGNFVQGNAIGTDKGYTMSLGNGYDGVATRYASTNLIGGLATGAANVVANNARAGVEVDDATGTAIRADAIFRNNITGIMLTDNGNAMAPAPTIENVSVASSSVTISATFMGAASTSYTLDFYANDFTNASGDAQGQVYLGSKELMTDASGMGSVMAEFTASLSAGQWVTASATDALGNTSAFSLASSIS